MSNFGLNIPSNSQSQSYDIIPHVSAEQTHTEDVVTNDNAVIVKEESLEMETSFDFGEQESHFVTQGLYDTTTDNNDNSTGTVVYCSVVYGSTGTVVYCSVVYVSTGMVLYCSVVYGSTGTVVYCSVVYSSIL